MRIKFGSADSTDNDILEFVTLSIPLHECKQIAHEEKLKGVDINFATTKNGIIDWCFKGTVDELNNCILDTYHLHEQDYDSPVTERAERDIGIKALRAIRGILSYSSSTEMRPMIKNALRSTSIIEKLNTVKYLCSKDYESSFQAFIFQNPKTSTIDLFKFLAVQIVQTMALIDGTELYTKQGYNEYMQDKYPEFSRIVIKAIDRVASYDTMDAVEIKKLIIMFEDLLRSNVSFDESFFGKKYEKVNTI